jgi:hypothetical protein
MVWVSTLHHDIYSHQNLLTYFSNKYILSCPTYIADHCYSRINSTKSPSSGVGNGSEPQICHRPGECVKCARGCVCFCFRIRNHKWSSRTIRFEGFALNAVIQNSAMQWMARTNFTGIVEYVRSSTKLFSLLEGRNGCFYFQNTTPRCKRYDADLLHRNNTTTRCTARCDLSTGPTSIKPQLPV